MKPVRSLPRRNPLECDDSSIPSAYAELCEHLLVEAHNPALVALVSEGAFACGESRVRSDACSTSSALSGAVVRRFGETD